jgi:hypothetical protein
MRGSKGAAVTSFTLAFGVASFLVWHGAQRLVDAAKIAPVGLTLDLGKNLASWQRSFGRLRGHERIALLGDSTMMADPSMTRPGQTLPRRIIAALEERSPHGHRPWLSTLCVPGLGPSGVYFIADGVVRARPDRVVIALNLRSFNREALRTYGYAENAGLMRGQQLWESGRLPLYTLGLTFDRLLLYKAIVELGAFDLWYQVREFQARAFKLPEHMAARADRAFGSTGYADGRFALGIARLQRARVPGKNRVSAPMAELVLGPVLHGLSPDQPALRLLAAALGRFERAAIPVLVYIEPVNLEHLRAIGVPEEGFAASLAAIRSTAREHGAQLADFHALFPDAAFRDDGDHYTFDGMPNGNNWLGDRIANAIMSTPPATAR